MKIRLKKSPYGWYPVDEEGKAHLATIPLYDEIEVDVVVEGEKPKTATQRAALHVWLEQMADALNSAGMDMKKTLKPEVDIPWTKLLVKEYIFKPVLDAMTQKESTEEMVTVDPDRVYKVICRHMADNHGFTCPPWPTRFVEK